MINDIYKQVEKNIDNLVDDGACFSIPVIREEIEEFKATRMLSSKRLFLPPTEWIPPNIANMKVLLLAGAGGQQAPLFAAIGADVTVIDISDKMLEQDRIVAKRENLKINIQKGNINDLSRFDTGYFDLIINPPSLFYVPDVIPVFKECYRVMKDSGIFIMSAPNPMDYIYDYDSEKDMYIARNKLPFISYVHDKGCADSGWVEYGHTLESYIGGQVNCGLCITGFYEDEKYVCNPFCTGFATRAVKC